MQENEYDSDDAVTRRYVASRFQALSDEVQGNKSKLGAFLNLLGVVNNQVFIREYKITGTGFVYVSYERAQDSSRIIEALFRKYPLLPDEKIEFEFFELFTLKENFIHLLEEPVVSHTWLRIKQPGTYTIHFDLICNSFSFELHTRDEVILLSEHNPKHDINLEKGENCLLVHKKIPQIIRAGSKIYVYYII